LIGRLAAPPAGQFSTVFGEKFLQVRAVRAPLRVATSRQSIPVVYNLPFATKKNGMHIINHVNVNMFLPWLRFSTPVGFAMPIHAARTLLTFVGRPMSERLFWKSEAEVKKLVIKGAKFGNLYTSYLN
jgi:hypothetical protein